MSEVVASYVPEDYVHEVWPKFRDYIAAATVYTNGRYEPEDVLDLLFFHDHQLWIAIRGEDIIGCIVTTVVQYPRKRALSCPFVTGEDFKLWKYPMLELLGKWATDNKCEVLESSARLGWERVFKDDGYTFMCQSFELPVMTGADNG